ncbi:hypothetical protein ACFYUV_20600 [Nonomuraea sp. NPDC003560]|uniref:VG15 protein n=1 Tax=Nonomuraea sp. NPDC003560 TaxID=3364341 RepID=UPI003693BEA8
MSVEQVAAAHYRAQQTIARGTVEQAQALWGQVQPNAVLDSWLAVLDALIQLLTTGQYAAASLTQPYLNAIALQQGITVAASAINPAAFAGVAAGGGTLAKLLMQPALRTLGLLARGADDQEALRSGLASLVRIVDTEISDASRAADQVGITANRRWVTYVRHVTLPACGRCIILAGRTYSYSTGFLRHPQCDCTMVPYHEGDTPPPLPDTLFAQMTEAEQNRAFTVGGAEAIRLGADAGQVVNARRGMQTVGGKRITTEGTTVRGVAGKKLGNFKRLPGERYRRSQVPRPMPEQILADAGGDRDEAIRLLEKFGYLDQYSAGRRARRATEAETARIEPGRSSNQWHPSLDGIEDLARAVESGKPPRSREVLAGGESAVTELLTLADGTRVVHKSGTSLATANDAEQLSSLVARALGLRAPRVYRNANDSIYMEYVEDAVTADELRESQPREWEARVAAALDWNDGNLVGLLDVLISNSDRNAGNWMLAADGRTIPIDHGHAYTVPSDDLETYQPVPEGPVERLTGQGPFADAYADGSNPMTKADAAEARRRLEALRPDFELIGRGAWLDYSLNVLDKLEREASGFGSVFSEEPP